MAGEFPEIIVRAIGVVRNEVTQPPGASYNWPEVVSELVIDRSLTDALDSLDEFSHIIVLYWIHRVDTAAKLPMKIHPRGNPSLPLTGLLATRSPHRPNPVGKATVKLVERRDNILRVKGLDAIDGSPIIDIKPYIPEYDSAMDARAPGWTRQ